MSLGRATEGRGLDDRRAEADVSETEAATHEHAVAEELLDARRMCVSGDVEVLGLHAEQEVPYAASH